MSRKEGRTRRERRMDGGREGGKEGGREGGREGGNQRRGRGYVGGKKKRRRW